jgi:hypothetical protein
MWFFNCCSNDPNARREFQVRKLEMFKTIRNDLETRLAGLNAVIETLERQMGQDSSTPSS